MNYSRKIIYLAGFLFSFATGLALYINSSFIATFIGEKSAGIVFTLASFSSIVAILGAPALFKKIGGYKFLAGAVFLDALTFLLLKFVANTLSMGLIFIVGITLNTLVVFSLDEFLKIFSDKKNVGKTRGIYLTLVSLALILAQVSHATILKNFSFQDTYLLASIMMGVFLILVLFALRNTRDPEYDAVHNLKYLKKFFGNKNLRRAYVAGFLVQFFYAWMVIYTPIYLSAHLGFSWQEIGTIFSIMLLPFLFVPFYAGKLSDKIGERRMLMFGFAVTALFTIFLFYINLHSVFYWAALLFLTRIGMSLTEAMSDTYFFKHIKAENDEFIGLYRTASPTANIIGPIMAFLVLILVPAFNFIYLILGALMLYGVYLSSTIRKSDN